ncbi:MULTISPECIES: hypothetical protein [Hyphobacterium]|uniref:Uncharacterized protein n=1 Tax=Hyphobacterium vulgare TaxID=1736751 RepID=A0ABV7A0K2_9PROT
MLSAFASALLLATAQESCVDHSAYNFDLEGARLREVEIVRSEPAGRRETGRFPDGTVVTVSADYCTDTVITMAVEAPLDAQNQMRLGQLMGRLNVIAGCTTNDWAAQDASLAAAAAAVEAGDAWNNDGAPIAGSGEGGEVTLDVRPVEGRLHATFVCTRAAG